MFLHATKNMSDFDSETIRDIAYRLSGKGKFNAKQFTYDDCGRKGLGYCSKKEFDNVFTGEEIERLKRTSSINDDAFGIKNLDINLIVTKYYPESTFFNDIDKVLACNSRKPISERLNADYVLRRCLEIKKRYYEIEIRKIENGAEIKKADFIKKKAEIENLLKASGI